jgi:flavin-dependent dehydrogenase
MGYAPRRWALDQVLVEAAVEAGAELRAGFRVLEYIREGGRVTGIRGGDPNGRGVTEHAIMTVGADGRRSLLARTVNAPSYDTAPPFTCWYFSYWSGLGDRGLELYLRGRKVIIAFPTNDGLTGIFVAWPMAALRRVRRDIEASFLSALDEVPGLRERVRAGRREERFLGATDLPNFFRTPFGPGWALVGDAGFHQDPYLALGISDAFRDAEQLAEAIDTGLSGRRPIEEAMAGYERARNESSAADYRLNLELARFAPLPPDLMRIRAAIRGDQEATNEYFLAMQGMIPRERFFNPENLERLARGAHAAPRRLAHS